MKKKNQAGFVDPLSLLSLGFLLITLVVTTAVTSNTKISQDLRGKAMSMTGNCPNGKPAPDGDLTLCAPVKTVASPQPTVKPTTTPTTTPFIRPVTTTGQCPNGKPAPDGDTSLCSVVSPSPSPSVSPTPTPIPSPRPSVNPRPTNLPLPDGETRLYPIISPTPSPSTSSSTSACKTCNANKQCVSRTKPCNEDLNQCATHQDCGTVIVCQPNETKCLDTKTLQTCKSDQTGWLNKTCEFGCENKACKAQPLLANGALCNSNSECQSNQCFASAAYYQGPADANGISVSALAGSVKRCHQLAPQDYKDIQAAENQGNLIAGMVALSFVPGVGPVLQFVGAASNAVGAYYTCSQISEASQNPQVTAEQVSQLKTQCGLYIAGTATSVIAGGSMAAAGNQTLTTAQQLAFSAVNLTDSAVNTAIADQQRQIVCGQNPSSSGCTMAYMQEGLGIGGLAVGAASTATIGNKYLTSQIDDLFGDTNSFRLTNAPDMQDTDALENAISFNNQIAATKTEILTLDSKDTKSLKLINRLVDQLTNMGIPELEAMTYVTQQIVPTYPKTPEEIAQLGPANLAKTINEMLACPFSQCRHNTDVFNVIAQSRGYNTASGIFQYKNTQTGGSFGHITPAIITTQGANGLIFPDPTNGVILTSNKAAFTMFGPTNEIVSANIGAQIFSWTTPQSVTTDFLNLLSP